MGLKELEKWWQAVEEGDLETIKALIRDRSKWYKFKNGYETKSMLYGTTIYRAIMSGRAKVVKVLMDAGSGCSLLPAAKTNYGAIVKMLIDAGADVNQRDDNQDTPLIFAAK